jgi:S1-C subfamily serine protease
LAWPALAAAAELGVSIAPNPQGKGILVGQVVDNGPAAKAGVKAGDVIVKLDDKDVTDIEAFTATVREKKAGDKLALTVLRDGKEEKIEVTLGEAGRRPGRAEPPARADRPDRPDRRGGFLGVQAQELTPELKTRLGVAADRGVLVADVMPDSPAAKAGFKRDDVIVEMDGKPVADPREFTEAVRRLGRDKEVSFKVARGKETVEVKAKLGAPPAGDELRVPPVPRPRVNPFEGFTFPDSPQVQELKRRVEELEKRVKELEQKASPPRQPKEGT